MLSILIPTYNYDCLELVEALYHQAQSLSYPVEILVADDASAEETKRNNRRINRLDNCKFIELKEKAGRAKIRNFLASKAQYDLLLFIDSDAGIVNECFLKNYIEALENGHVVCGGLLYQRPLLDSQYSLRYYYGISVEERSAKIRAEKPYMQFSSFNFLIQKETFNQLMFDESFTSYGHEDSYFGIMLQEKGIKIKHIPNPLYHLGLEENSVFLSKTRTSIETLFRESDKLKANNQLLKTYNIVKKSGFKIPYLCFFIFFRKTFRKNLLGAHPNMTIFSLYKLGYLCTLK